ncbi:MAG: type III pantothenate kinase [Nocardioides sp.]
MTQSRRLLAAEIGNEHTVLGLLEVTGEEIAVGTHWRVSTDERRTGDEWGVLVQGLLAGVPVIGVVVAATVPAVLHEWREMLALHFPDIPHVVVEPGTRTGLPVLVDNPREVGADRICNAVAAAHRWGGPVIVVDFGTATTFDVVNARGQYVGGAIAPGLQISLDALDAKGAQLRKVELARPRSVIAKNTIEALQSGAIHGAASMVEGIVARMRAELGAESDPQVISTGHLAGLVAAECTCFTGSAPWLTLEGLGLIFARQTH